MYKTQFLTSEQIDQLKKIDIKRQADIKKVVGKELNLIVALETIKEKSNNYQLDDAEAMKADELLIQLLEKNGIKVEGGETKQNASSKMEMLQARLELLKEMFEEDRENEALESRIELLEEMISEM